MWSTKYWDIEAEFGPRENLRVTWHRLRQRRGCVAQYGVDGFDITVTRVWSREGKVERREPLFTSYDAAPTVICGARPKPKPSKPSEKPTDKPSDKPSRQAGGGGSNGGGG